MMIDPTLAEAPWTTHLEARGNVAPIAAAGIETSTRLEISLTAPKARPPVPLS